MNSPLKNTKKKNIVDLLYKDLSYEIQGIVFELRKNFGLGHKEQIYQRAFEEELKNKNILYEKEKAIKIFSPKDGKFIGLYRPDFIIDNKIIIEIKTYKFVPKDEMRKIYDYLRNSEYELGYLINFASPRLYIKRIIFTNNKKNWLKKMLVSVSLWLVLFSGLPSIVKGAVLYFEPSEGEYQPGDTFIVKVKIDTEQECINTVKADLKYSYHSLRAVDFSQGSSIIALWVKTPEINQEIGEISFIGGIPGGYCGELPGDPGPGHLLGKIAFQVHETDTKQAEVKFLKGTQVLLNDGFGTPAKLTTREAVFTVLPEKVEKPKDEWLQELEKDTIPPEPFEIEISRDPEIFEGKYFIIFLTTDKQTGIDHYEVKEGKKDWETGESPYLLEDQSLQSIIKVKAVDKAGNERIAEYLPPVKPFPWWIILIIIGLAIIAWIIAKLRKTLRETTRKPKVNYE